MGKLYYSGSDEEGKDMTERKTYEFLKHLVTRRLICCLQDIKTAFSDPEWLELYRKVVGERKFRKKISNQ